MKVKNFKVYGVITGAVLVLVVCGGIYRYRLAHKTYNNGPEAVKEISNEAKGEAKLPESADYTKKNQITDYSSIYTTLCENKENLALCMSDDSSNLSNNSEETKTVDGYSKTNTRTEGVDEADDVKNDGQYLYILDAGQQLRIIKADKDKLNKQFSIKTLADEFFIDDNRLVLMERIGERSSNETKIDIYDITDRTEPKFIKSIKQDGYYLTSRISEGYLYTISIKTLDDELVKDKPQTYIPKVDGCLIGADCISEIEGKGYTNYMVMTSLNIVSPDKFKDCKTVINDGREYYVSTQNIYYVSSEQDSMKLYKFPYTRGIIGNPKDCEIDGNVNDSFSIDEYKGYLRIVVKEINSNSLCIYDSDLKMVGKISDIAKEEEVKSARFMGDVGYFVTYRNTDPLFAVDLSDPKAPKILSELKITGFSSYLHPYGEGKLIGFGYEIDEKTQKTKGIKLAMFDVSDPKNVKELSKEVIPTVERNGDAVYNTKTKRSESNCRWTSCDAARNYKKILVDVDKNIFGFGVTEINLKENSSYDLGECSSEAQTDKKYYTYSYDDKKGFTQNICYQFSNKSWKKYNYDENDLSGTYIGDYLYIVGCGTDVKVIDINSGKELTTFSDR